MTKKDKTKKKPGPKEQRLLIDEDPEKALDRLLGIVQGRAGEQGAETRAPEKES